MFWSGLDFGKGTRIEIHRTDIRGKSAAPPMFGAMCRPRQIMILGTQSTGLWYTLAPDQQTISVDHPRPAMTTPDPAFFQRPNPDKYEHLLIEGLQALAADDEDAARTTLSQATAIPDALWLTAMLDLKNGEYASATERLKAALMKPHALGAGLNRFAVAVTVVVPLTSTLIAHVQPCAAGIRLVLAGLWRRQANLSDALDQIDHITALIPDDPVAILMLAELAHEAGREATHDAQLVRLTDRINNETPLHTAVLFYRARALARLAMPFRAIAAFNLALRYRAGRPVALLRQIRYERAIIHDALGWRARARRAFEQLHAEDPGFEDVARRLAD